MDIREIALRVAKKMRAESEWDVLDLVCNSENFAEALIAELAKQNEPVARLMHRKTRSLQESCRTVARTYEECKKDAYPDDWEEGKPLYTFPPTAEQIANETAEACARYVNRFINGDGILNEVWISEIEEALRSGAWKEFKK